MTGAIPVSNLGAAEAGDCAQRDAARTARPTAPTWPRTPRAGDDIASRGRLRDQKGKPGPFGLNL